MADFKTILISKRKELGLSQSEMAEYLHVTRQAISKWENGKGMPDTSYLPQISELLGVSVDELLTGKEPEKQVVEKVVVQEKEVVKPMPVRKILAIVVPIVLVVVLVSALMGVYIPKAIENNTPPVIQEPEPEIKYTEVYIKGKSNTDDSCFQAPLIKNKAYYTMVMQFSSDYKLYITAPMGAVATLNGEIIAEFDTVKTVEYKQYFETNSFIKDWMFDEKSLSHQHEYILGVVDGSEKDLRYILEIDLTKCSEDDQKTEKQQVVLRQHYGFEDVIVPANSTYFVALSTSGEENAWHYVINSIGIKYVADYGIRGADFNYDIQGGGFMRAQKPISDFYLMDYKDILGDGEGRDRQLGFLNLTNNDIKLEIKEIAIEEIRLGQEVTSKSDGIRQRIFVYKLDLQYTARLICDVYHGDLYGGNNILHFGNGPVSTQFIQGSYRKGWAAFQDVNYNEPGWIYVLLYNIDGEDTTFMIEDWSKYYDIYVRESNS